MQPDAASLAASPFATAARASVPSAGQLPAPLEVLVSAVANASPWAVALTLLAVLVAYDQGMWDVRWRSGRRGGEWRGRKSWVLGGEERGLEGLVVPARGYGRRRVFADSGDVARLRRRWERRIPSSVDFALQAALLRGPPF